MKARVNGINIDYRDTGSGVPIVLVHAFPLNQTMWDEQVAGLSGRFRVITFDLRGFGASEVPAGPYWMTQMACDIRSLIAVLGIDRPIIAGLSMGGYAALSFYRNFPTTARALVLADTRAAADTEEARQRRLDTADRAEKEGLVRIVDEMVPLLLGPSTVSSRPDVVDRVKSMALSNRVDGVAAAQRGMAARRDSMAMLADIKCPTLVIGGSQDSLSPPAVAEAMQARITQARLRIIEDAGHLPNVEQPEAFNDAITDFVGSLKG